METWTIKKLIQFYEQDKLNLTPPYQRNEIWPKKSKQMLIGSIQQEYPIPNFFLYEKSKDKFDVVDGQQRSRAILGFYKNKFVDLRKRSYSQDEFPRFLDYEISVTIIEGKQPKAGDEMEKFYTLINSTGLKLNRPELKKAEYYKTRFLDLIDNLSTSDSFTALNLFNEKSQKRMTDFDFVSELIAQMKYGISEKKKQVDKMFEDDVSEVENQELSNRFERVMDKLSKMNEIYPIKDTRYRQKNDFYTLFGFINSNISLDDSVFGDFYRALVLVDEHIYPTNEDCETLKEYARNCVTQSNSKKAREERNQFFKDFLLNATTTANETQEDILEYFKLEMDDVTTCGDFTIISIQKLQKKVKEPVVVTV